MIEGQESSTATSSDSDERAQLIASAEAADRGEAPSPLETPPSVEKGGEDEQNSESHASEQAEKDSTDNPESSAEKPDAQQSQEVKPDQDSKYKKAVKEKARRDKTWKELETEKGQVRAEKARLAQIAQEIEQRRSQGQQPSFDSRQLASAAAEFDKRARKLLQDGDLEGANEQLGLAVRARETSQQTYQAETTQAYDNYSRAWQTNAVQVIQQYPELGDPKSEASQAMVALLEANPLLSHVADGFSKGVEILKLQRGAAEASGLREENKKLKTENERLNKLLSPSGDKPTSGHSHTKETFESLPLEEQRKRLQREVEDADRAAA